jgi:hypothetical protein
MFKESGCGLTLSNQFHGWPFDGIGVGTHMGCANAVGGFSLGGGLSYKAVSYDLPPRRKAYSS